MNNDMDKIKPSVSRRRDRRLGKQSEKILIKFDDEWNSILKIYALTLYNRFDKMLISLQ